MKRRGIAFAVVGLAILVAGAVLFWPRSGPRPNIILVTFDTTRADRTGAYGYQQGLTDAFDEFARRGVVFEKAYAPAPITLPSHATMLTGLYPPEHGLRINGSGKLSGKTAFLPELLKQQGYETGAFLAAPVLDSQYGLDRGFDFYDDDFSTSTAAHGEPRRDGRIVVDSALKWLEKRTEAPFFCWIHLYDAHGPYDPRIEVYEKQFESRPYDAGVAWEVQQFGRVTEHLKARNLDSSTMVIVVGDHGEGLAEHQEDEHGMLVYETTLLVPFVFTGPEQFCRAGTRVRTNVSLVDLTPTLLDMLEISTSTPMSGRSLLPAMKGQAITDLDCYAEAETPYVLNGWAPLQAVISGSQKYIQSTRPELYDLASDPNELTDRSTASPEQAEELRIRLETLQESFQEAHVEEVHLTEKDLENLRSLGYVGGSKEKSGDDISNGQALPDVKDFLPHLAKYEKAKHLVLERHSSESSTVMADAIAMLRDITQATTDFPMADALLGDCLAQTGQQAEAETTYRTLLSRHPNFFQVRLNLGRLFNETGRFKEAAEELRSYLAENPNSSTAYFELGIALTQLSEFEAAIKGFRQALKISPEFSMASLELGRILLQQNQILDAQSIFEKGIEHNPGSADLRSHLMMIYARTGQNNKAIEQGRQLIAIDPNLFDTRFNLALLLIAQQKYAEALTELLEAKRIRPDDARLLPQIQRAEAGLKTPE